jgi:hypothetical protein
MARPSAQEPAKPKRQGQVYAEKPTIKAVTQNDDKALILYGINNLYPNDLIVDIQNSLTAFDAVDRLQQFIQGDGWARTDLYNPSKEMANLDQTFDEVLAEIAGQVAYFQAFSLQVFYNSATGLVQYVRTIPFEKLRKRVDGTIVYNPRYGVDGAKAVNSKDDEDNIFYTPYDRSQPQEKVKQIAARAEFLLSLKEKERKRYSDAHVEIWYVMPEKPGQYVYPVPSWSGGIDDVKSEFELAKFQTETLQNGFHLSKVFFIPNDDVQDVVDQNNKVTGNNVDAFIEAVSAKKGTKSAGSMIVWTGNDPASVKIQELQVMPEIDKLISLQEANSKRVTRAFGIPPVLVGIDTAGALGNAQQLKTHFDMFNLRLSPTQRMIERTFNELYPNYKWEIKQLNMPFLEPQTTLL